MKRNKVVATGFLLLVCAPLTAQPTTPLEASAPSPRTTVPTPDSGGAIRAPKTEFGAKLGQGAFLTAQGAFTAVRHRGMCALSGADRGTFLSTPTGR